METPLVLQKDPKGFTMSLDTHSWQDGLGYYSPLHGTISVTARRRWSGVSHGKWHLVMVIPSSAVPGQRVDNLGY